MNLRLESPRQSTATRIVAVTTQLRVAGESVVRGANVRLQAEQRTLDALTQVMVVVDPAHNLRLGYSLTYTAAGKLIRARTDMHPGDTVTTTLADGSFTSTVNTIK